MPEAVSAGVVGAELVDIGGGVEIGVGVETGVGEDVVAKLDTGAEGVADDDDVSGDATGARGVVVLRTGGCRICGRSCGSSCGRSCGRTG